MLTREELSLLVSVAGMISEKEPGTWAQWVVMLLEDLDCRAQDKKISAGPMLEEVQRALSERLESGGW